MTFDFIYDFGSPNAYFCHKVLPVITGRTGATPRYVPCLLGGIFKATGNQAPMFAYSGVKGKLNYERIEIERFVKRHQLTDYRFNPNFPVNTLLLMRGACAAELDGTHEIYVETGMRAMWEQGLKMDDPEVFVQAMDRAGLDGARILERTQDPQVKQRLIDNTAQAVERGVFGIPSFFVGAELFFGKERLTQIEEEILHQSQA